MAEGERATGTPNTIYDLSSVLFHALEGGASYDTYIEDAEREGDQELVEFFHQVRDEDSNRADRAQQLIAERTPTAGRTEGMTTGAMGGTEPSGVSPMSEDVPPPAAPGQATPRREEGPPGREDPLGREDALPREERASLGREDALPREGRASLGREDALPREKRASLGREDALPREERDSLGREDALPREERDSLGREDPLPREKRARETEREEDKGLIERAKDAILGEEEPRRKEGTDRPPDRR
jgi:hypothetical protein